VSNAYSLRAVFLSPPWRGYESYRGRVHAIEIHNTLGGSTVMRLLQKFEIDITAEKDNTHTPKSSIGRRKSADPRFISEELVSSATSRLVISPTVG
jgi:hypothetical protein